MKVASSPACGTNSGCGGNPNRSRPRGNQIRQSRARLPVPRRVRNHRDGTGRFRPGRTDSLAARGRGPAGAARDGGHARVQRRQVRVGEAHVPRRVARAVRSGACGAARTPRGEVDAVTGELLVRDLGRRAYEPVWRAMQAFTDARGEDSPDELWLVEHDPVFTLGQAGKPEHVLAPGDIPVVQV